MNRALLAGIAALLLAGGGAQAQAQEERPAAPATSATEPAQRPVATAPRFISGPQAEYSDAERNAGHHGNVVIRGIIGLDGRFRDPVVAVSSGAPGLDAAALAAARATLFTPAKDEAGTPMETPARMPFRFSRAAAPGGGLVHYLCGAFAQDMTWWRATFPDRPWDDLEFYQFYTGLRIAGSRVLQPGGQARVRQALADFERQWERAIETCRARPDALLVDVLPPGG
jgi:TonB family protein